MRFLIDMNLSPVWAGFLVSDGHEARHWSAVGLVDSPDEVILDWAAANNWTIMTADLDFGAIVARQRLMAPCVVQIRMENTDPAVVADWVLSSIRSAEASLKAGSILTIGARRALMRLPHFDGFQQDD